ncbi:hypothetical protein [Klenkia marina]|uniref:hypothetical protein n=1 Tax=Klenkia marina TaxID=1960309 RepID=UPI0014026213|nr:hypothetical protein [Klenkia marina]
MIGQNDVDGEVFTVEDATALTAFARDRGLGRLSMWSINRDQPCGAGFTDVAVHSNTCSGVAQEPLAFTTAFSRIGSAGAAGTVTEVVRTDSRQPVLDDPATSPYPVWRADAQYPAGYEVVRHGQVHEARWTVQATSPGVQFPIGPDEPWAPLFTIPGEPAGS